MLARMSGRFYVTTPIYYPNSEPHLGTVYTTMAADVIARYHRLKGEKTFFLTGTDEHGTKMVKTAAADGLQPNELADRIVAVFQGVWKELDISHDDFIRTTSERHKTAVTEIVRRLAAAGDIYLGSYSGWYDEGQEEFVTETQAKEQEYKSAISGRPLTRYSEKSYFFRLTKYADRVLQPRRIQLQQFRGGDRGADACGDSGLRPGDGALRRRHRDRLRQPAGHFHAKRERQQEIRAAGRAPFGQRQHRSGNRTRRMHHSLGMRIVI